MTTWPTDDLTVVYLDSPSDDSARARAELYRSLQRTKDILATLGAASGVCELSADSPPTVPISRLPIIPVSGGGTELTNFTAHAPLIGDGNSPPGISQISSDAAGHICKGNGITSLPTFQAPDIDAWTLRQTASGGPGVTTIEFTGIDSYDAFAVVFNGVVPDSGAGDLVAELKVNGVYPSYSFAYVSQARLRRSDAATLYDEDDSDPTIHFHAPNSTVEKLIGSNASGTVYMLDNTASHFRIMYCEMVYQQDIAGSYVVVCDSMHWARDTDFDGYRIEAIKFGLNEAYTKNFDAGEFYLYELTL